METERQLNASESNLEHDPKENLIQAKSFDTETENLKDSQTGKVRNIYLLWSLLAALMMAVTSYVRTIVSKTPYASFFVLAFSYLVVSTIALAFIRWRQGAAFRMSWQQPVKQVKAYDGTEMVGDEEGSADRHPA